MLRIPKHVNVLLVGGGGREHALAWKLKKSKRLAKLWTTHPQNAGLGDLCRPMGFEPGPREHYRIEQFCRHQDIGLVVVGPEAPLAHGLADELTKAKIPVFGPTRDGAMLESDKAWAKRLMRSASIPTADAHIFTDPDEAKRYIESREEPPVIKAAGLAAGKGVIVCSTMADAVDAVDRIMVQREFGDAGREIVVEEKLSGPEVSVLALVDGRDIFVLDTAQDHKRIGEGDTGPNTGGMGAYSPTPLVDAKLMADIQRQILIPTVDALRREGIEYRGVLYAGLMLTHAGPKVLEFNVRFGDPECQCLLPRMQCDLTDVLYATATGQLGEVDLDWDSRASCCIVLASEGYPGEYRKGLPIEGLEEAERIPDVHVFHAGTTRDGSGKVVTAGGRVLSVVGMGQTIAQARERALQGCDAIQFAGKTYRKDIAHQAIEAQAR